jgi:VWFA-related protein
MDGMLKGFGPKDHSFEFNPRDLQPQLDQVLKLAVRYDVRFYTLDSRGLYGSMDIPGTGEDASFGGIRPFEMHTQGMFVAHENGDAMAQLARETGGIFVEDTNDLLKGIRRAFADGREGYVLAYIPSNTNLDGKFRKIAVEAKGKSLHIAAKTGYWATPQ